MNNVLFNHYKKQLSSFADDEDSLIYDKNGNVTFERNGELINVQLVENNGGVYVNFNNKKYTYIEFVEKELGKLDTIANRIVQKYKAIEDAIYVDPRAIYYNNISTPIDSNAIKLLDSECAEPLVSGTKICFVTADAGHGKTMLLKRYMYEQAKSYLEGRSHRLFWHIDLHGRELVRLYEAIMFELGELRITGLYYESIITLIKNNLIILAIDGFDELAAEIGGENALSSLNDLVSKMDGTGILIAASRRTFFNTQDYLKRSRLVQNQVDANCEIHELKLKNWEEKECEEYLQYMFDSAHCIYQNMLCLLQNNTHHPLLERPYLFTKICQYALEDHKTPDMFIKREDNAIIGIDTIINEFIKREVQKWKEVDNETGLPYLTFAQHQEFLANIASEMWNAQKEQISLEMIQFILAILMTDWNIADKIKPKVMTMAISHAFLIPVETNDKGRRFDHEEFRHYFLSLAFEKEFKRIINMDETSDTPLHFLQVGAIPNSVAQYISQRLSDDNKMEILKRLLKSIKQSWKPTYLQANIGTLLPHMLNNLHGEAKVSAIGLTFQSIVFEGKTLDNIIFSNCNFINISFKDTILNNILFKECSFSDIKIYKESSNNFSNVELEDNCQVNTVTIINKNEEVSQEYSPYNIINLLGKYHITLQTNKSQENKIVIENSDFRKAVKRFLNKYLTTTYQYEKNIKEDPKYSSMNKQTIIEEVIPLLIKYEIIEECTNNVIKQTSSRAWRLKKYNVTEVFQAEENINSVLYNFWIDVNTHK